MESFAEMESFEKKSEWLEGVFNRYSNDVLRYAFKLLGSEEKAREATQETFLRLMYANRAKVSERVKSWLFTVCRNIVLDRRKKEKRMGRGIKEDTLQDSSAVIPIEALEAKQTRSALIKLLDSLPEKQAEVIRLRFQNDFSYKEIAEILGLTVSNVGFLLHTGLKTLRLEFEQQVKSGSLEVGVQ